LQRDSPSLADRVEARFGYRNPHVHFKIAFATIPAIEYRPAAGRQLIRIKTNAVKDFIDNVVGREESRINSLRFGFFLREAIAAPSIHALVADVSDSA
jgi:hypothetical protein